MRILTAFAVAGCLLVSACETAVVPEATGGSRSDGTVRLSFEYGMFEKPQINWEQAQASAEKRCSTWGYTGADKFDAGERKCEASNNYGCIQWEVTVTYQCTGKPG